MKEFFKLFRKRMTSAMMAAIFIMALSLSVFGAGIVDLNTEVTALEGVASQNITASANYTGVNVNGYFGVLKATMDIGTVTGTSPTMTMKVQDSADNSTFADVAGVTFTQATAAGSQSIGIDTRVVRKYIRFVSTVAGTSPVFPTCVLVMGQKRIQ